MNLRSLNKSLLSSSNNAVSEPVSNATIGVHRIQKLDSIPSQSNSSNYVTMNNIDRKQSFYTVPAQHSQSSQIPIVYSNNNLNNQPSIIYNTLPSVIHYPNRLDVINQIPTTYFPVQTVNQNSQCQQCSQLKQSYKILKERYDRLILDSDLLRQRLQNTQFSYQVNSNQNNNINTRNSELEQRIFQLQQQLKSTKIYNEQLYRQLQQSKIVVNMNAQNNTIQTQQMYHPSLRQLEHQNRQILYRIQQYQSSILYKNQELTKLTNDKSAKEIQILSLRREIETFMNRQKIHKQEQRMYIQQKSQLMRDVAKTRQQIQFLRKDNQQIKDQKSQGLKKFKDNEDALQNMKQQIRLLNLNINLLQEQNNTYKTNARIAADNIRNQSKSLDHDVITTYIGNSISSNLPQFQQKSYDSQHQRQFYEQKSPNYKTNPQDQYANRVPYKLILQTLPKQGSSQINYQNYQQPTRENPPQMGGSQVNPQEFANQILKSHRSQEHSIEHPDQQTSFRSDRVQKDGNNLTLKLIDNLNPSSKQLPQQSQNMQQTQPRNSIPKRDSIPRIQDEAIFDFAKGYLQFQNQSKLRPDLSDRSNHPQSALTNQGLGKANEIPGVLHSSLIRRMHGQKKVQNSGQKRHRHRQIFPQDRSFEKRKSARYLHDESYHQSFMNQQHSFESLQRRIIDLAKENKSLRTFLTQQDNK